MTCSDRDADSPAPEPKSRAGAKGRAGPGAPAEAQSASAGSESSLARESIPSGYPPAPVSDASLGWRALGLLRTLRPHQWVKNVFVLAPVVFAKEIFDERLLLRSAAAFAVFCLLASAVYAINDLADAEADRQHPIKRYRPIASGRVPVWAGRLLAVVLLVAAFGAALAGFCWKFIVVALSYFGINLAYSFKLKHVAYVDVGCIAAGFVLRVVAGGYAATVHVSAYLLLCTALLAAFLGFGKRRHELAEATPGGGKAQRAALESYSTRGLDLALWVTALTTIGTYLAYTLDPRTEQQFQSSWLWVSTVFVVLGVVRFVSLVRSRPHAESPTQEMLRDGPFVATVLLWVILVMFLVYHLRPG
jgi:decaprenyl-phosphate phosphoribosyltransferase